LRCSRTRRLRRSLKARRHIREATLEGLISTAISFRTIIPGIQILVAIAIRVASAGAARAALRRSR
jgi:hypothetical protein